MLEYYAEIKSRPLHNKEFNLKTGNIIPKKRTYTVWVVYKDDGEWSMYHCPDCRNPIAQYKGELIAEVPGETYSKYPILIQCKNPKCGRKIMFMDAIGQMI